MCVCGVNAGVVWLHSTGAAPSFSSHHTLPNDTLTNKQQHKHTGVNFVLLLAAGSGIAPIRAAIESEALGLGKV